MCFFGDCHCSLSSSLGFVALTSFMAFICVLGSWKRSSLGGGKANSCAACFEGHNEGGFAVAPSGLQRRSSRVEKFKVWKALPIVVGGEMFSTVTGFPYGLVSRHNKRLESYNDNKAQSEPPINREHEERKHETLCAEIDLANF